MSFREPWATPNIATPKICYPFKKVLKCPPNTLTKATSTQKNKLTRNPTIEVNSKKNKTNVKNPTNPKKTKNN